MEKKVRILARSKRNYQLDLRKATGFLSDITIDRIDRIFVAAIDDAYRRGGVDEYINSRAREALDKLMDHIIANRGTPNAFVKSLTYGVPEILPEPYLQAEKVLLETFDRPRNR